MKTIDINNAPQEEDSMVNFETNEHYKLLNQIFNKDSQQHRNAAVKQSNVGYKKYQKEIVDMNKTVKFTKRDFFMLLPVRKVIN